MEREEPDFRMIKNIIFDMGKVLVAFDPDLFMDRVGVRDADRELLRREVYQSLEWARMDRGSLTDAQAAESMCARLPERLHSQVHRLVDEWDRPILPVAGMADLVKELKQAGYGIYLLSNASLRQHCYWPRVPGQEYFDGTLISADVKLVKPQFEIYQMLFQKFSLVPQECLFIDDAINNIEGAFCCGMQGIVFHNDTPELRRKLADFGIQI